MAELVDAQDSKSCWSKIQCGFESHLSDKYITIQRVMGL